MSQGPSSQPRRAWLSTADTCALLGLSRETLRRLRQRGILLPGKHFRRWGCTQGKGPLQWHGDNVEAAITAWSRKHLQE